ncbi:hypothetical protein CEE69_17775 [Rhodopirellula bahusiensis]|uniref:Uncharacterized protein n=1 Tax=Rhodopirellula bahusiensis TaxID=2014065 RepID=A0A2G1W422_9BACT|nr:hypothetical protein CEE69_17775 [Rhodopirellula bahusiensis]
MISRSKSSSDEKARHGWPPRRMGTPAFLYPTSFGSRLRWEYKRFKAKHPLPRNH